MTQYVKLVVYTPLSHCDKVRHAMGEAGAGKIGNYSFCSFTTRGQGRYKGETGAHPTIGSVGVLESVEEERIEVACEREKLSQILEAIKKVHPYEEVAIDVYPVEMISL